MTGKKYYETILFWCGKRRNRLRLLFALAATSIAFGLAPAMSTSAITEQGSISMSISDTNPDFNITPHQFNKSSDITIRITTDNLTGYTFSIRGQEDTSITNETGAEITSISSIISENTFKNDSAYINQWGYRPSQRYINNANTPNTNYLPAPSSEDAPLAVTTAPNTTANTYTIALGTKVDYTLPADDYHYTYTLSAVANIIPYTITYNANFDGDTYDIPEIQPVVIDHTADETTVNLSEKVPSSDEHEFTGWCDKMPAENTCEGTTYQPGDAYTIDLTDGKMNADLYALWEETPSITISYVYGDEIVFDGQNYLNTGIGLFSTANVTKDFKIEAGLKDMVFLAGQSQNLNNIVSDMSETGSPYPGFAFRYNNNNSYEIAINNQRAGPNPSTKFSPVTTTHISLLRKNQKFYHTTNDTPGVQAIDYSSVPTFDAPLTFGAGLNSAGEPFRYAKGALVSPTLSLINPHASSVTITLPTPTLTNEVFEGWYADSEYQQKIGDGGDEITFNQKATLYAKWGEKAPEPESYSYPGEITFDGTNYVDTGMHLYSRTNVNRNYEISFNIVSYGAENINQATIMNSLNEFDRKYPGVLMRLTQENSQRAEIRSSTNGNGKAVTLNGYTGPVKIIRIGGSVYYSTNNRALQWINDTNPALDWSNTPVSFGASTDENGDPFRNFKGVLSDLSVKYLSDDASVDDYDAPTKATEVVYSAPGETTFDGTSYIDTGVYLFNNQNYQKDFSISFEIVSFDSTNIHQATLVSAMKEGASPWPGTLFRLDKQNGNNFRYNFAFNKSTGSGAVSKYWSTNDIQKFKIMRKSGKVYIKINDRIEEEMLSITDYSRIFDVPLTFGAGLDENQAPFRYFKGVLKNLEIKLEPDE